MSAINTAFSRGIPPFAVGAGSSVPGASGFVRHAGGWAANQREPNRPRSSRSNPTNSTLRRGAAAGGGVFGEAFGDLQQHGGPGGVVVRPGVQHAAADAEVVVVRPQQHHLAPQRRVGPGQQAGDVAAGGRPLPAGDRLEEGGGVASVLGVGGERGFEAEVGEPAGEVRRGGVGIAAGPAAAGRVRQPRDVRAEVPGRDRQVRRGGRLLLERDRQQGEEQGGHRGRPCGRRAGGWAGARNVAEPPRAGKGPVLRKVPGGPAVRVNRAGRGGR